MTSNLFVTGLPFGQWSNVSLPVLSATATIDIMERLFSDVFGAGLSTSLSVEEANRLENASLNTRALDQWCASEAFQTHAFVGSDTRLCWTGSSLAEALPDARFLIYVEYPGDILSWILNNVVAEEAVEMMPPLLDSAFASLLNLVHRFPERCSVVDLDEARYAPPAASALIEHSSGHSVSHDGLLREPMLHPLAVSVADSLMRTTRKLEGRYERLRAASCSLKSADDIAPSLRPDVGRTAKLAVQAYLRLGAERSERFKLEEATRASNKRLTSERQRLLRDREAAAAEASAMMLRWHRTEERLEKSYLELRALRNEPALIPDRDFNGQIGRIEEGSTREEPPYRGITLILHGLRTADREFDRLRIRLVEHHGVPGLAIYRDQADATPLVAWTTSGQTKGRDYMLLLPDEPTSQRTIQNFASADWRFVRYLTHTLLHYLASSRLDGSHRWIVLAKRFSQRLQELPLRFRFGEASLTRDKASARTFVLCFRRVSIGDGYLRTLRSTWNLNVRNSGAPSIELSAEMNAGDAAIFSSWPLEQDGRWSARWLLPMMDDPNWNGVGKDDQRLLLAWLEIVPAAVRRASRAEEIDARLLDDLEAAASTTFTKMRLLLYGTRLGQAIRALRGHVAS